MNAIIFLQKQLANINAIYHTLGEDLTDQEWVARPALHQNLPGYIMWHIPRTQDMHVQTWIRGVPEVFHAPRWAHWQPLRRLSTGIGISLDEADALARHVGRAEVLAYADEVHQEIIAWLGALDEAGLDPVPAIEQHLAPYPEYQTPWFVKEAGGSFGQPVWSQLMRPCLGHVQRHLGELEVVKNLLRQGGQR